MEVRKQFYTSERRIWRAWLEEHFKTESEIWLVYPMKDSGEPCILYNDAVEEALCFGWIDSTIKYTDPMHRAQRFTPRRKGSSYSQPNIERLKWLDQQGLIHPEVRGELKDILETEFVFPEDIIQAIREDEAAWEHYNSFSQPYKRIRIAYIEAARNRPEEFQKRLDSFIRRTHANKLIIGYGGIEKYYSNNLSAGEENRMTDKIK